MSNIRIYPRDLLHHADDINEQADLIIATVLDCEYGRLFEYQQDILASLLKRNGTLVAITHNGPCSMEALGSSFAPLRMGRWVHGLSTTGSKYGMLRQSSFDIAFMELYPPPWLSEFRDRQMTCGVTDMDLANMMRRSSSSFIGEWVAGIAIPTKAEWEAMTYIMESLTTLPPMSPFEKAVRYYKEQPGWEGDVWTYPRPYGLKRDRLPPEVIRRIICMTCPPGGTVFDIWSKYGDVVREAQVCGCHVVAGGASA